MVVRYRESGGTLRPGRGDRVRRARGADPAGVIRFGPDGALYVGLGSRTVDRGHCNAPPLDGGRILRLTADGRTPRDNPGRVAGLLERSSRPERSRWLRPATHVMGSRERTRRGRGERRARRRRLWLALGRAAAPGRRARTRPRCSLPAGTMPSGMAPSTTIAARSTPTSSWRRSASRICCGSRSPRTVPAIGRTGAPAAGPFRRHRSSHRRARRHPLYRHAQSRDVGCRVATCSYG